MVLVDNKTIEFRVIETAWNYSVVSCRPPGSSDTIGTLFGFNLPDGAEPLCFADVNIRLWLNGKDQAPVWGLFFVLRRTPPSGGLPRLTK